jgi:hypothetical protein
VIENSLNVEIDSNENIEEAEEDSIFEIFQTDKKRNKPSEKLKLLQEIRDLYFEEDEIFFSKFRKMLSR